MRSCSGTMATSGKFLVRRSAAIASRSSSSTTVAAPRREGGGPARVRASRRRGGTLVGVGSASEGCISLADLLAANGWPAPRGPACPSVVDSAGQVRRRQTCERQAGSSIRSSAPTSLTETLTTATKRCRSPRSRPSRGAPLVLEKVAVDADVSRLTRPERATSTTSAASAGRKTRPPPGPNARSAMTRTRRLDGRAPARGVAASGSLTTTSTPVFGA